MARIVGNDGNVTFAAHSITASSWTMTISRVVSDVTGFDDIARSKLGGIAEITGSLSGFLDGDTDPDFTGAVLNNNYAGSAITLTATTGRTWVCANAIVSNISVSTTKTGDCTVSLDFAFSGDVSENWS
tara:strand:+ start:188 stop:574 length:387 start_codon:yes stop_codon:yes gene_type:complete